MRIIGGLARGTKLYTLEGLNTRPTLDKVREAIFNILQNNIRDTVVLDLFAGSGAVGLESISRGAMMARVLINFLIIIKIKTQIDCQNNFMEKMANILHIY